MACYLLKRRRKTERTPPPCSGIAFWQKTKPMPHFKNSNATPFSFFSSVCCFWPFWPYRHLFPHSHRFASEMLIVLIDTSASMQSTDVAPSRMHQAHEAVEELIATMDGNDQMMLIAAGNPTRVIQSATSSHADLRRALKHLQSTDTATRLSGRAQTGRDPCRRNRPCANPSLYRWSCQ